VGESKILFFPLICIIFLSTGSFSFIVSSFGYALEIGERCNLLGQKTLLRAGKNVA
jgi:hypothetical protein